MFHTTVDKNVYIKTLNCWSQDIKDVDSATHNTLWPNAAISCHLLTHLTLDKMAAISQTILLYAFLVNEKFLLFD